MYVGAVTDRPPTLDDERRKRAINDRPYTLFPEKTTNSEFIALIATGRNWSSLSNYDLCVDSSKLGIKGTVETPADYIARRLA